MRLNQEQNYVTLAMEPINRFELYWSIAVLGQNQWLWLLVLLLLIHFYFTPSRAADLLVLPWALFGLAIDMGLTAAGVFSFDHWPIWLALLWCGFVLTLKHSLRWLANFSWLLISLLGAIFGAFAYLIGAKLGAVILPYSWLISAVALAITWALLLPLLVHQLLRKAS